MVDENTTPKKETKLEDVSQVKIYNVDITQSKFLAKNINDCTVVVSMSIPSGNDYKFHLSFKDATVEDDTFTDITPIVKDYFDSKKELKQDTSTNSSKFTFDISNELLKNSHIGKNILKIEISDVVPKEGTTGKSSYEYELTVENRNFFNIERPYKYKSEYLVTGSGNSITNENGFTVKTTNGILKSVAIPKQPIEMDGRAKIRSITVDATEDTSGECQKDVIVIMQEDEGDYIAQTIPFTEVLSFTSIDKVQAINANLLK